MTHGAQLKPVSQTTPGRRSSMFWTWSVTSLPQDVLEQSCKRIGIAATVFASLWAMVFIMNGLVAPLLGAGMPEIAPWPSPGAPAAGVGLAMSVGMIFVAAKLHDRPGLLLNVGLVFEVATAFLIGLITQWEPQLAPGRISWICVIILLYPSIVPNTPGKTLAAAVAAASMDPLGFGIAVSRGVEFQTPVTFFTLLWTFLPNYVCAALSVVPVHVIRGLGRQVTRARELGSYKLGDRIGAGGMGEIYRAEHRMLARPAAIKLIRPEFIGANSDASLRVALERFRREAQAAAVLRSPHTINLYDFGTADNGTFYLVMELLDGLGLDALVERFGPVEPERAVHLVAQACESLAEAHSRGLMHRDIKPSNIFTNRLGLRVDFVKVLDFGLVKVDPRSGREQTMLTAPEVTTGTPAFMAPELALGDEDADHRLDIYSMGGVLYWLLTGQLVFDAKNAIRMMHRHIQDRPQPPSQRSELHVPAELDHLVLQTLAKEPDDRPQSAMELAALLRDIPFDEPWTPERAARWWETHLPECVTKDSPCDKGTVMPAMASVE